MQDRNELAASFLAAMMTRLDSPSAANAKVRARSIQAAFVWADEFIEAAKDQAEPQYLVPKRTLKKTPV